VRTQTAAQVSETNLQWHRCEDRAAPPAAAPDGLEWERRVEKIDPAFLLRFFGDVGARRLDVQDDSDSEDDDDGLWRKKQYGPLWVAANWLYRRVELVEDMYVVRVVRWRKAGVCGFRGRGFSGLGPWPTVPPEDVGEWMSTELNKGIPRSHMGRSAFGYSKLIKVVARWGLRPAVSDVDMCISHFQLRLARLTPKEREA